MSQYNLKNEVDLNDQNLEGISPRLASALEKLNTAIDELKKNRDNKIDMITDDWIVNNWSKIIDQIEFLYNEWDCYYKEGMAMQGSPNKIRKRSSIYEKRMEIEKNVNQLLHEDIFTKRFKQACYTIMDKDKKKQKK